MPLPPSAGAMLGRVAAAGLAYTLVPLLLQWQHGMPTGRTAAERLMAAIHPWRSYKIWLILLSQLGQVRYLPAVVRGLLYRRRSPRVLQDVPFGDRGLRLDVYLPPVSAAATSTPDSITIVAYGGAWMSGSRLYYGQLGKNLSDRGHVVVIPDYTLFPKAVVGDMVRDLGAALSWTVENAASLNADAENVTLLGHSAGAHLWALFVLQLAAEDSAESSRLARIRRVLALSGVYHIAEHYEFEAGRGVEHLSGMARTMQGRDCFDRHSPRVLAERMSGTEQPIQARFMVLHGTGDSVVPPSSSVAFAAALQAAGLTADLKLVEGLGHATALFALIWDAHEHQPAVESFLFDGTAEAE